MTEKPLDSQSLYLEGLAPQLALTPAAIRGAPAGASPAGAR